MSAPDPLTPIPLAVLTGALGAGKTRWLNGALADPALADTLVIINEFGELGLDHLLVEEATGDVVLMAAGCLCCSLRSDLVATLEDLLRRRDNHRMAFFRRVVIETTGLADPAPVLQSLLQHPYLSKRFALAGTLTFVDALHAPATLATQESARRQVALADALVLTKTDLATPAQQAASVQALARLNPRHAPVPVEAMRPQALFTPRFFPPEGDIEGWLGTWASSPPAHDAGVEGIESFAFMREAPVSEAAVGVFVEAMRVMHGARLLRLKGIVHVAQDSEHPVVIHQVQSVSHPPRRLARWPTRDRRTRIVAITQGLPRAMIEGFWDALAG